MFYLKAKFKEINHIKQLEILTTNYKNNKEYTFIGQCKIIAEICFGHADKRCELLTA